MSSFGMPTVESFTNLLNGVKRGAENLVYSAWTKVAPANYVNSVFNTSAWQATFGSSDAWVREGFRLGTEAAVTFVIGYYALVPLGRKVYAVASEKVTQLKAWRVGAPVVTPPDVPDSGGGGVTPPVALTPKEQAKADKKAAKDAAAAVQEQRLADLEHNVGLLIYNLGEVQNTGLPDLTDRLKQTSKALGKTETRLGNAEAGIDSLGHEAVTESNRVTELATSIMPRLTLLEALQTKQAAEYQALDTKFFHQGVANQILLSTHQLGPQEAQRLATMPGALSRLTQDIAQAASVAQNVLQKAEAARTVAKDERSETALRLQDAAQKQKEVQQRLLAVTAQGDVYSKGKQELDDKHATFICQDAALQARHALVLAQESLVLHNGDVVLKGQHILEKEKAILQKKQEISDLDTYLSKQQLALEKQDEQLGVEQDDLNKREAALKARAGHADAAEDKGLDTDTKVLEADKKTMEDKQQAFALLRTLVAAKEQELKDLQPELDVLKAELLTEQQGLVNLQAKRGVQEKEVATLNAECALKERELADHMGAKVAVKVMASSSSSSSSSSSEDSSSGKKKATGTP